MPTRNQSTLSAKFLPNKANWRFYFTVYGNRLEKAKDISKLVKKFIIDKNRHKRTVYVKLGLSMKKDILQSEKTGKINGTSHNSIQHDGEFVLTRNGSKDFGEISPEIAQQIRRQAGKIQLRIEEQETNSE